MVCEFGKWKLLTPAPNSRAQKKESCDSFSICGEPLGGLLSYRSMPLWRRSELTVSFLRPLARRELNTLRPFADDMRFRKPCLFRRLRTEK